MKHYSILTDQRDRHFMQACRRILDADTTGSLTTLQVVQLAAAEPAPAYYLSFDYTLRTLRSIRRTGRMPRGGKGAGAVWHELLARTDQLQNSAGISDYEATARVLATGRASRFFITPATALRLFHRIRHRNRRHRHFLKTPSHINHRT